MAKRVRESIDRLETGMLSFPRSVQPSEGVFWGTLSGETPRRIPVEVVERGVRGQSSEFKTDNPGKSNPQVVEAASVPLGCHELTLEFTLWIAPRSKQPGACDDATVADAYQRLVKMYAERDGFLVLAGLYAWNIANARFAWRNRWLTDESTVEIEFDGERLAFDPARIELDSPPRTSTDARSVLCRAVQPGAEAKVDAFIEQFRKGLERERSFFRVAWRAQVQEAQEVFPSQEYLRDELRDKSASRVYAKSPRQHDGRQVNQAAMHSQKIGAALRHIDIWHGDQDYGAIAINPYGGVQETSKVLRDKSSGKSFYALRSDADLFGRIAAAHGPDDLPGDAHFVVANLVRGGVFGQKSDE